MLDMKVLGVLKASRAGVLIHPGGPKQRLVLAHLATAQGATVAVDVLAADLWSEDPDDPAHALQAHVSRLRSTLGIRIERVSTGYQIDPDQISLDSVRFERLHAHGLELLVDKRADEAIEALSEALAMWHGPVFGDLNEVAGLQPQVARLQRLHSQAMGDLVDAHLAAGRFEQVIPELYAQVESDPLVERAWVQLLQSLNLSGQRSEALEAYRRARKVFVDELGLEPGPELQAQHRRALAAGKGEPSARRTGPVAAQHVGLVGRGRELAELNTAWQAARTGLQIVTVSGDPGIGKTRLVADFVTGLDAACMLWTRCDDALGIAYQPVIDLLRADLAHRDAADLASRIGSGASALRALVPDLIDRLPDGMAAEFTSTPETERQRILDAFVIWFTTVAADGPLCLVIDDVQWADAESPHVLRHLLSVAAQTPALVVMTYRDREHADEPTTGQFNEFLRHSPTVTHLPLTGLDNSAVATLLANELSSATRRSVDSTELIDHITEITAGNPLYVLELARQLELLDDVSVESFPQELPAGLRAVVGARLRQLPDATREAVQVAAVLGQRFDPLVLGRTGNLGEDITDDFLTAASYARLIEEMPGPVLRYQFTHAIIRSAAYEAIPRIQRARLHLAVATAMEESGPILDAERLHELAHHHVQAAALGTPHRAIEALIAAGDVSAAQRAPSAALGLYERAWQMLPVDVSAEMRCDLLLRRGTAAFEAGQAYREHLLMAARLAQEMGDETRLTAAAVANNRGWYSSTSEVDYERVILIEAALQLCSDTNTTSRSRLLSLWAMENVRAPQQRELALSRSKESFELACTVDDPVLLGEAMCDRYSVLYATFDDPHGCVEIAGRLYEFAHSRLDPELQLNAAIALAQGTMMTGDFATADRALERSRFLAEELRHPARTWLVRSWQAARILMRGDLTLGEATALEALELGVKCEQPDAMDWFAGQLFGLHHVSGRLAELVESIEEQAVTHADGIPAWRAAYAVSLTAAGRHRDAEDILDEFVATDFAKLPVDMLRLLGLCYLTEVSLEVERADAAKALYDHLLPYTGFAANNATIDAGPVDLYLGMAAFTIGDITAARHHLSQARVFCTRTTAPLWQARTEDLERRIASRN
ncbi:ATP-binding protein [Nocardioides soli]|uniref:DNA-binding SARP family transcriptional activator n=1 Tax=Nocardioides soli TaxID=1036020 RepID=A0A7W4VWJ3_9ACTN|nr:BTAD domain-containing putative transcriptional regulator [Nocardioides soli]MBB3043089.1 DNA-binding SARP family transcriptional activator [Nocardioides soli]